MKNTVTPLPYQNRPLSDMTTLYRVIIFSLFLLGANNINAQKIYTTTNKENVSKEKQNLILNKTYFIGHSLMEGIDEMWSRRHEGEHLKGCIEEGMSLRNKSKLRSLQCKVNAMHTIKNVVIYLGNNDYDEDKAAEKNAQQVAEKISSYAERFVNKQVYVLSLRAVQSDPNNVIFVKTVNKMLSQQAKDHHFKFVDMEKSKGFDEPGLHPSPMGYIILGEYLFEQLK